MKITKRQLRRIIKEERAKLVNEVRQDADVNREMVKDEFFKILQMMDRMERVELEELRAHKSSHWSNDMISKMADIALGE
jgi:hypothetical protein